MKRFKRGFAWLLAMIAVVTAAVPVVALGAQYDLKQNTYLDVKQTPTGKTGQKMTLSMIFTNNGSEDLKNVSIRFDDDAAQNEYDAEAEADADNKYTGSIFPFEITSSTFDAKTIGTVKAGTSKNVSLAARVRRDISEGYYAIPIMVRVNGTDYRTEYINVWITKSTDTTEPSKDNGTIRFELGENQPTPYGEYPNVMNFSINLRNTTDISAFDVNVKMGLDQDSGKFPFDINDGNYTKHFERVGGGETVELPYSMAIRSEVYSGYYGITFTIEYRDSTEGELQKSEQVFYVHVKNKEKEDETKEFNANDRTRARIIVDSFATEPETVYAGQDFELILRMKNASETVAASNILFTLESEKVDNSAVFTTDEGSSSVVVNSLGAGQTTELRFKFAAGAGVSQRTYSITINEKYDSPEYKNAEEKVSIDIPVRQIARLNTGTIEIMPDSISVGSESNIMFQINNTGKVLLYNVMVTFESDSIQKTDAYVGNIEPGKSGNVDTMLTGIAPTADDGKIKIHITYEDENGVVSEPVDKEISLMVSEAMDENLGMDEGMDFMDTDAEPTGIKKYQKYAIPAVIVVLVAGTVLVIVILRRRKKKKAENEEVDDEV